MLDSTLGLATPNYFPRGRSFAGPGKLAVPTSKRTEPCRSGFYVKAPGKLRVLLNSWPYLFGRSVLVPCFLPELVIYVKIVGNVSG